MTEDFRVTFFFGPDNVPGRPEVLICVFNVKKRSWKGGVQVGVELTDEQLKHLRECGQLEELVEMIRAKVEPEDFIVYERPVICSFNSSVGPNLILRLLPA